MLTDTKTRIISYIRTNGQARVKDLVDHLGIGQVAIHRHLKTLLDAGQLAKVGTAPKVFYQLSTSAKVLDKEIAPRYLYSMSLGKAIGDQLDSRFGPNLEKMEQLIDNRLESKLGLEPGQTLDDELKYLPSKKEFFDMDEVMGELKVLRDEVTIANEHYRRMERQVQGLGLAG